ncbi:MAG: class I SAM-dependent methyltransferase [Patescibacteria group bacterium]
MRNIIYWEKLLDNLTPSYKKWFREEKKYLRKNITRNAKVLEVGCGEGRSLNDIVDISENIVGIDHDKKAVTDAKSKFKNYPRVKIILADARNLPFKRNTFDFVICMTTFANFGNQKIKILKQMKEVVKEKGIIIISVFSEDAFKERMKMYRKLNVPIKKIKGTTVIFNKEVKDNISEQFSKKQLVEIFNKVKLKIIEIKKVGMAYLCKSQKI